MQAGGRRGDGAGRAREDGLVALAIGVVGRGALDVGRQRHLRRAARRRRGRRRRSARRRICRRRRAPRRGRTARAERERAGADRLRRAADAAPDTAVVGERLDEEQLDGAAGRLGRGEARRDDARVVDHDERAWRQQRRQLAHVAMLDGAGRAVEHVEARVVAARRAAPARCWRRASSKSKSDARTWTSAITRRCSDAPSSSRSSRLLAAAQPAPPPPPLAEARGDVDGDGRADRARLERDGTLVVDDADGHERARVALTTKPRVHGRAAHRRRRRARGGARARRARQGAPARRCSARAASEHDLRRAHRPGRRRRARRSSCASTTTGVVRYQTARRLFALRRRRHAVSRALGFRERERFRAVDRRGAGGDEAQRDDDGAERARRRRRSACSVSPRRRTTRPASARRSAGGAARARRRQGRHGVARGFGAGGARRRGRRRARSRARRACAPSRSWPARRRRSRWR